jgi:thioester reductase-like protein
MSHSSRTPLLLIGTGLIGGSLLKALLALDKYDITALVRSEDKATTLKGLKVTPLLGTLDDEELIVKAALANDVCLLVCVLSETRLTHPFSVDRSSSTPPQPTTSLV